MSEIGGGMMRPITSVDDPRYADLLERWAALRRGEEGVEFSPEQELLIGQMKPRLRLTDEGPVAEYLMFTDGDDFFAASLERVTVVDERGSMAG